MFRNHWKLIITPITILILPNVSHFSFNSLGSRSQCWKMSLILSVESLLISYADICLFISFESTIHTLSKSSIWRDCITFYIQFPVTNSYMSIHLNAFIKMLSNFGLQQFGMHSFIEICVYVLLYYTWLHYSITYILVNIHPFWFVK